ncbi:hypothetical protein AB4Y67_10925 [Arthrobacter sp. YAF17]|uniref:hypothetical protein n=1 Tax=Arthrobacter sp. YAF17 TaxID=3233077 RepID=UPI003F922FC2
MADAAVISVIPGLGAAGRRAWTTPESFPKIQQKPPEVLSTLIIPRVLRGWSEKTRAWRAPELGLKLIIISAVA